jgi:hypothetical protein
MSEPTVRGSAPLAIEQDGRVRWLKLGGLLDGSLTYEEDEKLEALYQEAQMRYAARTDSNQAEVIRMLRDAGYSVEPLHAVGEGVPDLLVGGVDRATGMPSTWIMEVKTERGTLNKRQKAWRQAWRGQYAVVKNGYEALAVVGVRL